ncbi:MAG: bifunctional folylpolyglutamate synthase/dihydrofolate synthase [Acidimicrobiales bacterium]
MDYAQALAFLDEHTNLEGNRANRFTGVAAPSLPTAGQVDGLSLDPMLDLMGALGDPHQAFRSIHITGTNGKGSTARVAAATLQAMDLSVGLYTSPNLEKVNERMSWDGNDISDEAFGQIMAILAAVEPLIERVPSRFELLTAAAFMWFAEQGADVAVVEVGLLGRYDATNVIDADVAVITNIGKDHTDGKSGWERAVAAEKAGIIKPSSHVVLGTPMEELRDIFEAEPSAGMWVAGQDFEIESNIVAVGGRTIDLRTPGAEYEQLFIPAHGAHMGANVATGIAAVEAFFQRPTPEELVINAVGGLRLAGRFEVVGHEPTVILDGAHNPEGAEAAKQTLDEEFARLGSWVLVVGLLSGKDPVEMLEALGATDFDAVICTEPNWSRAVSAEEVAAAAATLGITAEVVRKPVEALNRALAVTAADDLIMVAGSLYVVGDIRSAIPIQPTD